MENHAQNIRSHAKRMKHQALDLSRHVLTVRRDAAISVEPAGIFVL
jgi:hypothetical protein